MRAAGVALPRSVRSCGPTDTIQVLRVSTRHAVHFAPECLARRRQARSPDCRRNADETPHHGARQLNTAQRPARTEPGTVRHLWARGTTFSHVFNVFPKPGVAGSIPAGGATSVLHWALSCRSVRQHFFRIGKTADILSTPAGHPSSRGRSFLSHPGRRRRMDPVGQIDPLSPNCRSKTGGAPRRRRERGVVEHSPRCLTVRQGDLHGSTRDPKSVV